jgi:uncharacterized OB-fold protein
MGSGKDARHDGDELMSSYQVATIDVRELAQCEKCGHYQAEPNWCHRCGHRTSWPEWAKRWEEDTIRRHIAEADA